MLLGKYYCPVCRHKVYRFAPLQSEEIAGGRLSAAFDDEETLNAKHYACPHCRASDRSRLYVLYLETFFAQSQKSDAIFLDVAPVRALSERIRRMIDQPQLRWQYRSVDLFLANVDIKADISNMPEIDDNSFDFILCSHVLEHIPDDIKAIKELYRVMKPGGQGIMMVPISLSLEQTDEDPSVTDREERIRRFGQWDHLRKYAKCDFVSRLQQAGFVVTELGLDYFGAECYDVHGIVRSSILYVVSKGQDTTS